MRPHLFRFRAAVLAAATLVACDNAGEERVLSISATGVVNAFVYMDANGNRQFNGGEPGLAGVQVGLIARGTTDTIARTQTNPQGAVRFAGIPVGHYIVTVDTTSFGDSIGVTQVDSTGFQVLPADSAAVLVTVSFPQVTTAQLRALPLGEKVFVQGLVLVSNGVFGDSTVHLRDSTGSLRLTGVTGLALAGDSGRFVGVRAARAGQPVLNNVSPVALLGVSLPTPPSDTVTNAVALVAGGAFAYDAALISVLNDSIVDTLTLTAAPDSGDFRIRVFDGSDTLVVLLDQPGGSFSTLGTYAPGLVITELRGLLVPTGSGTWRLKPRSPNDLRCGASAC